MATTEAPSDAGRINDGMPRRRPIFVRQWDLTAAVITTGVTFALEAKEAVRDDTVPVLLAGAAAGLAVLSVVLAAIAVFATFFDSYYRRVLEAAGGIRQALAPYLIVAGVGAAAAVLGLIASLAWPIDDWLLQAALASVTIGVAAYAILGALSLVELTIFHAQQRAELQRGIEDAKKAQARKLRETKAS